MKNARTARGLLAASAVIALTSAGTPAFADEVVNDIQVASTSGNEHLDLDAIGASATVGFWIQATDATGNGGQELSGCDIRPGSPLVVEVFTNSPSALGITATTVTQPGHPSYLTFTGCGTDKVQTVTITALQAGGGSPSVDSRVISLGSNTNVAQGVFATNHSHFKVQGAAFTDAEPPKVPQAALTVSPTTGVYGSTFDLTTGGGSGTGAVTFERVSGTACSLTGSTLTITAALGGCVVRATKAGDANYNATSRDQIVATTPATLTVTPDSGQSKTYGAVEPTLTYAVAGLLGTDTSTYSGSLSRAGGDNAGSYRIGLGSLVAGNTNYALSLATTPVDFTITQRALVVTPNAGQSKTYGSEDPTLTYTLGTLLDADSTNYTGALTRAPGEDAGSYRIGLGTLAQDNANYVLSLSADPVDFAIAQRPLVITPTSGQSKTYGDGDPVLAYTAGSLLGTDTTTYTGTLDREAGSGAGSYLIGLGSVSAANTNYVATLSSTPVRFTVNRKSLTVTADNKSKVLNAADPALTYTVPAGGLVGADALSGALTRTAGETIGSYPITAGTLTAGSNYDLTVTPGSLAIGFAPATQACLAGAGHGILQPISPSRKTAFKLGSTVPAKFRVCDANGVSIGPDAVVRSFKLVRKDAAPAASVVLDALPASTTPFTEFRWSSTDRQWIYNMATKGMIAATYSYEITLTDGSTIPFTFGLK